MQHHHSTISTYDLSGTPRGLLPAQHSNNPSDLSRGSTPCPGRHHLIMRPIQPFPLLHQRRVLDPPFDVLQKRWRVASIHWPLHRAGVHGIDGAVLCELPRPRPRHGLDGGFASSVNGLPDKPARRRNRGNVDDSSRPVFGKVRLGSLDQKQRTEDIDAVSAFKLVDCNFGEGGVICYACVVDDDVDLEFAVCVGELGLSETDDLFDAFWRADICLDRGGP